MVARRIIAAPLALLLLAGASSGQRSYAIDPAGSKVSAKVSFLGIGSKTAQFPRVSGTARISADKPQDLKLDVSLDARALIASDRITTNRLRGEKFFWVEKHPAVRFTGNSLKLTSDRKGIVQGHITARGVTKPVQLNVTFDKAPATLLAGQALTIRGQTRINRRDFGMTSYSLIVGKTVSIDLRARVVPR